jgi:hypothetical protein
MGVFAAFVNAAVVGNIIMMVFVPAAKHEMRALSSRVCCVSLVLWLLLEMRSAGWRTVEISKGAFVFVSSPAAWVAAHATYRMVLLSLSCFDSLKYLLLEATSLSLMFILHSAYDRARPISHYFGFADTISAATTALTTGLIDIEGPVDLASLGLDMGAIDRIGFGIQASATCFALWHCWRFAPWASPRKSL